MYSSCFYGSIGSRQKIDRGKSFISLISFHFLKSARRSEVRWNVWVLNLHKQRVHDRNPFMYTISNTFNNTFCQLPGFSRRGETAAHHAVTLIQGFTKALQIRKLILRRARHIAEAESTAAIKVWD